MADEKEKEEKEAKPKAPAKAEGKAAAKAEGKAAAKAEGKAPAKAEGKKAKGKGKGKEAPAGPVTGEAEPPARVPRLKEHYEKSVLPELMKRFSYKNPM